MAAVQQPESRFYRSPDRMVGGVCSGLAAGFHIDPLWVRLAFVVLAFIQGIGVVVYVVLWLVMPERPGEGARGDSFSSMAADLGRAWGRVWAWIDGERPAAPEATGGANAGSTSTGMVRSNGALWVGGGLIVIGAVLLAGNSGLVRWDVIWPLVAIALGAVLLWRGLRRP